jgi:phage gpG-like protein
MPITLKTVDFQRAVDTLKTELKKFRGGKYALVGIHEDADAHEGTDMTMASLGAFLNFGGDIDHPGGTSYGYATPQAAEDGKVTFLKKGTGYMELGVTQPHKVTVPARPWLEPGVQSGTVEIIQYVRTEIAKGSTMDQVVEGVGIVAAGATQQFMTDLKTPPNAASTIRKKGSDNPLIDTGALRASVTSTTTDEKPMEGIQ